MKISETIRKARDKTLLKDIITSIKQSIRARIPINGSDIMSIERLAVEYPNDPDIQRIILEAQDLIKTSIKEVTNISLVPHEDKNKSYTKEQYNELLTKENKHFNSKEKIEHSKLITKVVDGSRINDNDKSGNAITSKEFTKFIKEILIEQSPEKEKETKEVFVLIPYDIDLLMAKEKAGQQLTKEESLRQEEALERLEQRAYELLYTKKFEEHQQVYLSENKDRTIENITVEEVIEARGNDIIQDVIETYSKVKESFRGMEEKLAALVLHNPKELQKHHGDITSLKKEAEKSHTMQKEIEHEKKQANITAKTETKVGTKAENEILTSFRDMLEENKDKKSVKNAGVTASRLNALKKDKKGMLPNPQSFKAAPINSHYNTPSKPKPNSYSR